MQYDVGFDKQLNLTNGNVVGLKKKNNERRDVFAHVFFGKWSKQGKGMQNFDHSCFLCLSLPFFMCLQYVLLPRLSLLPYAVIQCVTIQTPHSVTVAVLTGSLDCLVIQLKQ